MRLSNKKLSDLTSQLRAAEQEAEEQKKKVTEMSMTVEAAEAAKLAAEAAKAAAESSLEQSLKQQVSTAEHRVSHAPASSEVCRYFIQGTCRNGASCKYRHDVPFTTSSTAVDAPQETAPSIATTEVHDDHVDEQPVEAESDVADHLRKLSESEGDIEQPKTDKSMEAKRLAEMRGKLLELKRRKVQPRVVEDEEIPADDNHDSIEAFVNQEPTVAPQSVDGDDSQLNSSAFSESVQTNMDMADSHSETLPSGSDNVNISIPDISDAVNAPSTTHTSGQKKSLVASNTGKDIATTTASSSLDKSKEDADDDEKPPIGTSVVFTKTPAHLSKLNADELVIK